jgi:hypothetical protein
MRGKHFEATVVCPYCSSEFRACIHSDHYPNADERFEVYCPEHKVRFVFIALGSNKVEQRERALFLAKSLQQVETCEHTLPVAQLILETPPGSPSGWFALGLVVGGLALGCCIGPVPGPPFRPSEIHPIALCCWGSP